MISIEVDGDCVGSRIVGFSVPKPSPVASGPHP